jgi:dual oxidase
MKATILLAILGLALVNCQVHQTDPGVSSTTLSRLGLSQNFYPNGHYEYESYDGWYNNPAHPEWGGADLPMERKTPIAYPDGVYEIAGQDRPNVLIIANLSQNGLTGRGSYNRTGFFIFFGQQVVEEVLDAQRAGCIPEYEFIKVPKCHPLFDRDCRGERLIPFLRNRYDFGTGYSPNNPRMQLNEITPWMDGGLMYGPFKAWTDAIRRFQGGELAAIDNSYPLSEQYPQENDLLGLPFANPPPPFNNTLFPVNRFWTIGNPRGNENPFLLTMGILWFRVHNWWARRLRAFYDVNHVRLSLHAEEWENDEWLFNRARQFTIATHQKVVYKEWLPIFLFSKYQGDPESFPYKMNPGYSLYFNRTGYNPSINPQVAHIFQSAAMRFGHTMVTPGIWRRIGGGDAPCQFGPTLSPDAANFTNSYLRYITNDENAQFPNVSSLLALCDSINSNMTELNDTLCESRHEGIKDGTYVVGDLGSGYFAPRTCNQYWNPQPTIRTTNVDSFYLGMASQRAEREDFIITPDLRGFVFGGLDFTRRDLMAQNLQRGRDHGLPDFNSARVAYGLRPKYSFEDLNPAYGEDGDITANIERLRDVYNNRIDLCDIWACGLAETTTTGGPGELFSEVLFDQFMRIRHGDRFWYENYENNGLFTQEEFEMIEEVTLKDLLIATTSQINDSNIQDNPFLVDNNTMYCPQPFQLSELYMDDCTPVSNFDYYDTSVWEIPFVWSLVFLYIFICTGLMIFIALVNQRRRTQILNAGRTNRTRKIDGVDLTGGEGSLIVVQEEKAGLNGTTRYVCFKLGPEKQFKLFYGEELLRTIDLTNHTSMTIQIPVDNEVYLAIKIKNEYDVLIRCQTIHDRTAIINKIKEHFQPLEIEIIEEQQQKRVILRNIYTKKDRQTLLENFFKSVFSNTDGTGDGGVRETRSDILDCELTMDEFADALSTKKDSLFVEQMFALCDSDQNGFISFREFADMTVIFSKGSPDEKLELMFRMYDLSGQGNLQKTDFKRMLKSMMELVNTSVTPQQMDNLIDSMFTAAGFQSKEYLTVDDFKVLMRDHKEELSNAKINVQGIEGPEIETPAAREDEEGSKLPSRYQQGRETATARARRTIVRAYGRTTKVDPRNQRGLEESTVTLTTKARRNFTQNPIGQRLAVFVRWVENYKLHIFYLSIFFFVTVGIFVERAYYYSVEREFGGLRRIAGYGVTVTRGAASCMMWAYSVLLLTMARNLFTYLRETIFNYYIPFDSHISFHKIVALTGLLFTVMHCIGHGINFYHIATQTSSDLTCIFREVYFRSHFLPKFSYWLFLTMTGFSAFVLTLVTIVIFVFAVQYARRYAFQSFWLTHHLYIVFYILMFLHGSGRLVQDPLFGNFFLGPGIVYVIDRLISLGRSKAEVSIVKADILPSQVVGIYFKRPPSFEYSAGQWVRIACLAQNPGEYHPFTLSSAPNEENLSLHIRAVGPWTHNFREILSHRKSAGESFPKLYVDGPFGEGHQDWYRFEVAVLVGGGIGVTPFSSILKELVHRFNIGARIQCVKVYFIWVTRTQHQFEWMADVIKEVEEADGKNLVENHIFITQFFDKFDLRTSMLYIAERHFQRLSGRSLFTGMRAITHFGRPDFNTFFDSLATEHGHLPKIGVFSCGPPGMTNGVDEACAATNRYEGPAFIHHFENF